MWIVRLALRRQYTFIVMSVLILIMGVFTIQRTPKDVFPNINIPVVSMIWSYTGISPTDMEKRITTICERASTTTVDNLEHIESQSYPGITVIRYYFQPGASADAGVAELTSISQTLLRIFPPGTTPPLIIKYSASSVPILQLGLSSKTLSETQLYDLGTNFVRTQLATVQGASIPTPWGGRSREIMIDLDLPALLSKGLTPVDVSNALSLQNLILPTGTAKIGSREYNVLMNSSPAVATDLGNVPIKEVNGAMVYIRDVGQVHDGFAVQTNIVRINGKRSALITVLKNGDASTLDVVQRVKDALPAVEKTIPKELNINPLFDQSLFVRASVEGVIREGAIAACLTAAMILLFLGSWRSTLIVAVSIPLSILSSICFLGALGQTLNVMTLGGMALAVGILVDDATVTVENIHRNMALGKSLRQAILDGLEEIATPTFVATLSICIVFVSVIFLTGPAKFLFTPLAMAVVFAMLSSYVLSRSLVPVMTLLMLPKEAHVYMEHSEESQGGFFWVLHRWFNYWFERLADLYGRTLGGMLQNRRRTITVFCLFFVGSMALIPFIGRDFFPSVDAGQIRLHVRAPSGTRIENTAHVFSAVEDDIKQTIPARDLGMILDNIGLPVSGINLAFTDSATIGAADGEILISLKDGHRPTAGYVDAIRARLHHDFPNVVVFFQPADIVSQILNFGLPAPIDIQIVGRSPQNFAIANEIAGKMKDVPGAADVNVHQVLDTPSIFVNVDRSRAQELGLTQRDVANNMLLSLSGSGQVAPSYWLDPKNGVNYFVAIQTPQHDIDSLEALEDTPINATGAPGELLRNVATMSRTLTPQNITHYNVQPTYDVYVNDANRDLGGLTSDVQKILSHYDEKHLPRGTTIVLRGQTQSMNSSFVGLGTGILFAIILVYLLMVVNFQSLIDPLIIICALPGALSGIVWMLFLSGTTFNVPSLMGTIMCIGVGTANSILVITFANDRRQVGDNAIEAAYAAGRTRLRPVLMTALAMIIGMFPMALGLGEGGEQNAPLGRAVIGGLLVATFATLLFVPTVYSVVRKTQPKPEDTGDYEPESMALEPSTAGSHH